MKRPTLSDFRAAFPTEVMGVCQADTQVITICNDAQQRLMLDPITPDEGWWGGWATMTLSAVKTASYAYVTTPQEVARIIVMGVCTAPVSLRNGFYEYLKFGAGLNPKTACQAGCGQTFAAYDRDNVVTLSDLLTTAQTIRIYPTDARDIGLRVLLQGVDANGQVILTTDPNTGLSAPGEYVALASPFVNSANYFTKITGIQKDQTYGPLQFFQVDPTTGVETVLSGMEPNEQQASYRRYLLNGIPAFNCNCAQPSLVQMTVQARLDFIPCQNETDYLSLPCVPALVEEAISLRFSRMDSGSANQKSGFHHMRAIALLSGQLDLYSGKVSTAIRVPLWGSQKLRRQPV
jgi:hypothetical protein